MKDKRLPIILFTLLISLSLTISPNAQSKKKNTKLRNTKTVKVNPLTVEQSQYVETILNLADEADNEYNFYINGLNGSYKFSDKVLEMRRVTSVELPEPLKSQVNYMRSVYSGWRSLFDLITSRSKYLDTIQYQAQLDSIRNEFNLGTMTQNQALNNLKELSNSLKNNLRSAISLYPKADSKTESKNSSENTPFYSEEAIKVYDATQKLKSAVGKWQMNLTNVKGQKFTFNFFIEKLDNDFLFVLKKADGSIYSSIPIKEQDNKYYIELVLPNNGVNFTFKYIFDDFSSPINKGIAFGKNNADYQLFGSFEITRILE